MKALKKLDWKARLLLSALAVTVSVILLLFGITYFYFVNKLTVANERIARNTFREAEERMETIFSSAEQCLGRLANRSMAWDFAADSYTDSLDRVTSQRDVVEYMKEMLLLNNSIHGFGIWSGDGRCIARTAQKSRTGTARAGDGVSELFRECYENYPYILWVRGEDLSIAATDSLSCLTEVSALVGVKALREADSYEEDSYLLVALDEEGLRSSFSMSAYNGSRTILLDAQGEVLSSTDEDLLGLAWEPDPANQNIVYPLSFNGWQLVNIIPVSVYRQEARDLWRVGLVLGVAAVIAVAVFFYVWVRRYTAPIQELMESMERVGQGNLEIGEPHRKGWPELESLNAAFYRTVQRLKDYISRLKESERARSEEELRALQYQINPHFLQNSLNSIRWMAMMTNSTKVADSLMTLSKIIMPVFRNPSFTWRLSDELEFLKNYVEMMQIRYGSSLEYHTEYDEALLDELLPRFIIQPVIENCFAHGSSAREIRQIWLRIRKREYFVIEVENSGVFLDEETLAVINGRIMGGESSGNSLGLVNVRQRLRLLYGEKSQLWMDSDPEKGLVVYIRF